MSNYLVFTVVAFIESQDLRFQKRYNKTEKFCSLLACLLMVLSILIPLAIGYFYKLKLYKKVPYYENKFVKKLLTRFKGSREERVQFLNKLRTGDNLFRLFLFTKKHMKFMRTYGVLIEGLRIRHLGANTAIMTPMVETILKFCIAVCVTRFVDWPVFSIFAFNFIIMFYL
jgi:hypothetical protein